MNNLVRHYPNSFSGILNSFFNDNTTDNRVNHFTPMADVVENEKVFRIDLAIPGMKKDDIEINIKSNILMVSGKKNFPKTEDSSENFHLVENQYGTFNRSFKVPESVDQTAVEAKFENGMLSISLPKDAKLKLQTKVEIK